MGHCGQGGCLDERCRCNCEACCAAEVGCGNTEEQEMDRRECEGVDASRDDRDNAPCEFSETLEGYEARERWAREYDDLDGAPEGGWDR